MKDLNPIADAKIRMADVTELKPHPSNPRTHTKKQVGQIAKSIECFGFCNPILIDEGNRVIAGHGRLEAAKKLGMKTVPTLVLSDLSEAEKRAYIVADNRLAELAGWDDDLLSAELSEIAALDDGFDLELTGFDSGAIEQLIEEVLSD
ncbi:ParB/Srx family N-terminal domain-containing protein [Qipengyuania sp. DGS5-3]|uniref:ParB/Srx family N-terminal domain-containing protein n=1 Tax=Qipengyuania sp. DGS5-3 TaxID=3349632 RepID=UPI0036D288A9